MPHHQRMHPMSTMADEALMANTQEIPVTASIFEGHLYLRTEKKRWQWRLFRFDGSVFTCLSTRKVKLPPHTTVDRPTDVVSMQMNPSASFNTSLTSPLLATPKDKAQRLVASDVDPYAVSSVDSPVLASYYQLPKWTVDVTNISAISVLKRSKKRTPFSPPSTKPKCFCIRTYDNQCYVMKAQNYTDLERWLFVLTKMWKFAQTLRNQMAHVAPSPVPYAYQHDQQLASSPPQLPLHQHRRSALLSHDDSGNSPPTMRNLVPPPRADDALPTAHFPPTDPSPYDARYRSPALSSEKMRWIDEWRASLDELANYDPNTPPPIETLPDDSEMSASFMTSISARERTRRRPSLTLNRKPSRRSLRSRKSASSVAAPQEMPLDDRPSSSLKKKRSDEVKNWISSKPERHEQDHELFMDAMENSNSPAGTGELLQAAAMRYHSPIQGKNIRTMAQESHGQATPLPSTDPMLMVPSEPLYSSSSTPRRSLEKMDSSSGLQHNSEHIPQQQQQQQTQQQKNVDDDEDMSLADLQKSLRRMSIHNANGDEHGGSWRRARNPSASTVLDRRVFHPSLSSPAPIVAPAVPPVPLTTESFSPYFALPVPMDTKKKSRQSFDIKAWHHDAKTKTRPQSWVPAVAAVHHKQDHANDSPFPTPADLEPLQYR